MVYVLLPGFPVRDMSNQFSEDPEGKKVVGFEVPASPDSSYNCAFPISEDEAREPPLVPQQLQSSLLGYPVSRDGSEGIQTPTNVVLNHLYIENRDAPRSVVALGFTHRFHAKYISAVLYKAVQRRGGSGS